MLTSHGNLEPKNDKKFFWGILIAVVAFVLIMSGSISVIQTVSIVIAFPYVFILLLLCVSLVLELKADLKRNLNAEVKRLDLTIEKIKSY